MSTVAAQSQRNGVDVAKLFAMLDAVKAHPEAARFRFGVNNRWISGTHNRNEISTFYGVGAEQQHDSTFAIEADHPAVLVGGDAAPTPAEILLAALASCLTSGLGNIAAVRKINLESVESRVEGDIDLRGILGLSDEVPQRLQPDPDQLPGARRRVARGAAPAGAAGRGPVRRV